MKLNAAEIGELYSDDSGWERRVSIDLHAQQLEICVGGTLVTCDPKELVWLINALQTLQNAVATGEGTI